MSRTTDRGLRFQPSRSDAGFNIQILAPGSLEFLKPPAPKEKRAMVEAQNSSRILLCTLGNSPNFHVVPLHHLTGFNVRKMSRQFDPIWVYPFESNPRVSIGELKIVNGVGGEYSIDFSQSGSVEFEFENINPSTGKPASYWTIFGFIFAFTAVSQDGKVETDIAEQPPIPPLSRVPPRTLRISGSHNYTAPTNVWGFDAVSGVVKVQFTATSGALSLKPFLQRWEPLFGF